MLKRSYEPLTGNIASFVRYRAPYELIVEVGMTATKLVKTPLAVEKYLVVRAEWFSAYATNGLGEAKNCYIAKLKSDRLDT